MGDLSQAAEVVGSGDVSRYFILRGSSDPEVLGNQTGIKQADIKREGFRDPAEYDRLVADLGTNRYWQIRDSVAQGNYDVQHVKLFGKSKLTDFLQFGPFLIRCPFMISEAVHHIMTKYHICSATTFPARVERQNGEIHKYRLLYLEPMPLAMVDFSQSTYFNNDYPAGMVPLAFDGEDEFAGALARGVRVRSESIVLKPEFSSVDMFQLHDAIVVSGRLKMDLEANHATSGIHLLPAFGIVHWPLVSVRH
jgi:hypothetical protein